MIDKAAYMYYSSCELLDDIVSFCCQMVKERKRRCEERNLVTMVTSEREDQGLRPAPPKLSMFTQKSMSLGSLDNFQLNPLAFMCL